jgi:hypothetical protein
MRIIHDSMSGGDICVSYSWRWACQLFLLNFNSDLTNTLRLNKLILYLCNNSLRILISYTAEHRQVAAI